MAIGRRTLRVYRVVRMGWRRRRILMIANLVLFACGVGAAVVALRVIMRRRRTSPESTPVPATPQQGAVVRENSQEVADSDPAVDEGL
jgi:hypothetical protein